MENKPSFEPLEIGRYVSAKVVKETVSQALEFGLDATLKSRNDEHPLRGPEVGSLNELIPDRPAYPVSIQIFDGIKLIQEVLYNPSDQIYKVFYSSN